MLRAEGPAGELRGFLVFTVGWHGDKKHLVPQVDWLIAPGDSATFAALIGVAARAGAAEEKTELLAWSPPNHRHTADLQALGFETQDSRFNLCIRIFTDTFDVSFDGFGAHGQTFVEVFEEVAAKLPIGWWLGQGTIYPDVIE